MLKAEQARAIVQTLIIFLYGELWMRRPHSKFRPNGAVWRSSLIFVDPEQIWWILWESENDSVTNPFE